MKINYEKDNETMQKLAKTTIIQADSNEGRIILDLAESVEDFECMNKGDVIYLCSVAYSLGKMMAEEL